MRGRVATLLGREPDGLWIGTFHAICARLLRREAAALGFGRAFTIYDEDDSEALVRRVRGGPRATRPRSSRRAAGGARVISRAKNAMSRRPRRYAARGRATRTTPTSPRVYAAMRSPRCGAPTRWTSTTCCCTRCALFRGAPGAARRLARPASRSCWWTSTRTPTARSTSWSCAPWRAHGNLFVVGDDDQSIYGWRGADVRNMLDFERDFPGATAGAAGGELPLHAGRSSTPPTPSSPRTRGRLGKTLRHPRAGAASRSRWCAAADERDEAEWVVREFVTPARRRRLEPRRDGGARTAPTRSRAPSRRRSVAPACRTALVGAISFYDRREVKDLLAYLRLVANPRRRRGLPAARSRVPAARARRDQPGHAGRGGGRSGSGRSLATAAIAGRVPDLRPNVRAALAGVRRPHRRAGGPSRDLPPADVLRAVIAAIGYEALLLAEGPRARSAWENVRELVASAADVVGGAGRADEDDGDAAGAVPRRGGAAAGARLDRRRRGRGVTLMTLHTAKGLEWPARGARRARGRALPARARRGAPERARGGAAALLRGR